MFSQSTFHQQSYDLRKHWLENRKYFPNPIKFSCAIENKCQVMGHFWDRILEQTTLLLYNYLEMENSIIPLNGLWITTRLWKNRWKLQDPLSLRDSAFSPWHSDAYPSYTNLLSKNACAFGQGTELHVSFKLYTVVIFVVMRIPRNRSQEEFIFLL